MASIVVEQTFGSVPSYQLGVDAYDATKLGLASLMTQKTGASPEDSLTEHHPVGGYAIKIVDGF